MSVPMDLDHGLDDDPCPDCDQNAPHGENTEEEMDVADDDPDP